MQRRADKIKVHLCLSHSCKTSSDECVCVTLQNGNKSLLCRQRLVSDDSVTEPSAPVQEVTYRDYLAAQAAKVFAPDKASFIGVLATPDQYAEVQAEFEAFEAVTYSDLLRLSETLKLGHGGENRPWEGALLRTPSTGLGQKSPFYHLSTVAALCVPLTVDPMILPLGTSYSVIRNHCHLVVELIEKLGHRMSRVEIEEKVCKLCDCHNEKQSAAQKLSFCLN